MKGVLKILLVVLAFSFQCCHGETAEEVLDQKMVDEVFNVGKDQSNKIIPVNEEIEEKPDNSVGVVMDKEDQLEMIEGAGVVFNKEEMKERVDEVNKEEVGKVEVTGAELISKMDKGLVVDKIEVDKKMDETLKSHIFKPLEGCIEIPLLYKLLIKIEKPKEPVQPTGDPDIDIRASIEKGIQNTPWRLPLISYGPALIPAGHKLPFYFPYNYPPPPLTKFNPQFIHENQHHNFFRPFSMFANKFNYFNTLYNPLPINQEEMKHQIDSSIIPAS